MERDNCGTGGLLESLYTVFSGGTKSWERFAALILLFFLVKTKVGRVDTKYVSVCYVNCAGFKYNGADVLKCVWHLLG